MTDPTLDQLAHTVDDVALHDAMAAARAARRRPCVVCGEPTSQTWCSTRCYELEHPPEPPEDAHLDDYGDQFLDE